MIPTGGIIVFIGVCVAALVLIRTVRDEEVSLKFLSDHLFFFVFIPFFFGRLGAFFSLWPTVRSRFPEDNFWGSVYEVIRSFLLIGDGNLQADWAIGGFFVVFCVLALRRKEKYFAWLDAFILPGIVLAFFVALGGYFSGWNNGRPSPDWLPFPFSIKYELLEVQYSVPIYAVQLYSAVLLALVFWIGWQLWQRKIWRRWRQGKFFLAMVFVLGVMNAFLEFFRGDEVAMPFGMRLPQLMSILMAVGAFAALVWLRDKPLLERFREKGDFSAKN